MTARELDMLNRALLDEHIKTDVTVVVGYDPNPYDEGYECYVSHVYYTMTGETITREGPIPYGTKEEVVLSVFKAFPRADKVHFEFFLSD